MALLGTEEAFELPDGLSDSLYDRLTRLAGLRISNPSEV